MTGKPETRGSKEEKGRSRSSQKPPAMMFLGLCVQRQAAGISVLLCFLRLGVLPLEVGEGHVQRLVPEPNANRIYRHALFVQRVSIGLAVAVKLGVFDPSFLRNRLQLAQEVPIRLTRAVGEDQIVRMCVPLSHSVLDLPNKLRRDWDESVLRRFLFLLALQPEMAPG